MLENHKLGWIDRTLRERKDNFTDYRLSCPVQLLRLKYFHLLMSVFWLASHNSHSYASITPRHILYTTQIDDVAISSRPRLFAENSLHADLISRASLQTKLMRLVYLSSDKHLLSPWFIHFKWQRVASLPNSTIVQYFNRILGTISICCSRQSGSKEGKAWKFWMCYHL